MNNLSKSLLVACSLVLGISSAHSGPKEEAYAVVEAWAAAFNALDADKTVDTYAPDATVHATASPNLTTGSTAIQDYFKSVVARKVKVQLQDWSALELTPEAVAIAGFYEFSGVRPDGQSFTLPARYSFAVFKRNGAWRIGHHHSSPRPKARN